MKIERRRAEDNPPGSSGILVLYLTLWRLGQKGSVEREKLENSLHSKTRPGCVTIFRFFFEWSVSEGTDLRTSTGSRALWIFTNTPGTTIIFCLTFPVSFFLPSCSLPFSFPRILSSLSTLGLPLWSSYSHSRKKERERQRDTVLLPSCFAFLLFSVLLPSDLPRTSTVHSNQIFSLRSSSFTVLEIPCQGVITPLSQATREKSQSEGNTLLSLFLFFPFFFSFFPPSQLSFHSPV